MEKVYILYNELSGNGKGKKVSYELKEKIKDKDLVYKDILKIDNYNELFENIGDSDVIICGGDGTLNYFINDTEKIDYKNEIYFYPAGTGNDFLNDIGKSKDGMPVNITKYLKKLPKVKIDGKETSFLNGIGYGIDGYCCKEGDKIRKKDSQKKINYTNIAIKGLLYDFKPVNAKVTVDGESHEYKNVWLAPTMNGRFYGGGMMIAPNQDRLNEEKKLSLVVMHSKSKIKTLIAFPTVFKGEHVAKHKDKIDIMEGYNISVEFDRPTALQIDGETVLNVKKYEAFSKGLVNNIK